MRDWIGSAVVAVVISSFVTVAGWFMTLRHERLRESERRRERIEDIQTALLADIRSTRHRFDAVDLDLHLSEVTANILRASDGYTPFVPSEPGSLLWSSVADEIHILPNAVIDAVVLYFSQLESVRLFVEDLRTDRFTLLEGSRKATMYADYVRMLKYLVELANEAENALALSLDIKVSSQASVPSDRSKASGWASTSGTPPCEPDIGAKPRENN